MQIMITSLTLLMRYTKLLINLGLYQAKTQYLPINFYFFISRRNIATVSAKIVFTSPWTAKQLYSHLEILTFSLNTNIV